MRPTASSDALVLDASSLLMGFDPLAVQEAAYTTPAVINEVVLSEIVKVRLATAQSLSKLIVRQPATHFVRKARQAAARVGEGYALSEADIQVLALALELMALGLQAIVITDDYALQNVADTLRICYKPLAYFGISARIKWTYYCPACFRRYRAPGVCAVCGTELRRRVLRKSKTTRGHGLTR